MIFYCLIFYCLELHSEFHCSESTMTPTLLIQFSLIHPSMLLPPLPELRVLKVCSSRQWPVNYKVASDTKSNSSNSPQICRQFGKKLENLERTNTLYTERSWTWNGSDNLQFNSIQFPQNKDKNSKPPFMTATIREANSQLTSDFRRRLEAADSSSAHLLPPPWKQWELPTLHATFSMRPVVCAPVKEPVERVGVSVMGETWKDGSSESKLAHGDTLFT